MRSTNYRSRLARNWLEPELIREVHFDNLAGATGAPSDLTPRCMFCSAQYGRRTTVVSVQMVHSGRLGTGQYYTDFKAKCHGMEEVLRIKGMRWDAVKGEAHDLAAIAALPFFHISGRK